MNRTRPVLRASALIALLFLIFASCNKKAQPADAAGSREWKEMDEFHMVMAETFHPFKDSADLMPVKEKAGELVAAAEKWAASPIPEKVDNDEMKTALEQLEVEAKELADLIPSADDAAIGQQLEELHDLFHKIQEDWYGTSHGHDHHHE